VGRKIFAVACVLLVFAATELAGASKGPESKGRVVGQSDSVTYVGCLRSEHGQKFLLTDIGGKNAPKGRSWKTAFIGKHAVDIEVIGNKGTKLKDHVNHTVQITGRKDGDRVTAHSVKFVGATCS
jgi:hypothetical protein